jgi:hypothetical protein
MKRIIILILAFAVSPAIADVYRCNSGGKTIYQDAPCPYAKVIDNINGQSPSRREQIKAMERATRAKALVERLSEVRAAESPSVTTIQTTVSQSPVARTTNRPDRYYDRPDRYQSRTTSGPTTIRSQ